MVHTDHGGPGHTAVTRDHAWPALLQARRDVPGLIQFNGMEFDVPAGEHASLIIAPGPQERDQLVAIERDYSRSEPLQGSRDDGQTMLEALAFLIMIGMTLIAEGFGAHVPKGYVYAAMAFSATVETLNILARRVREKRQAAVAK